MDNQTEKYYLKNARLNFTNEVDKHNLPIELTLEDIAKLKGCEVEQIKIKA